MTKNSPQLPSDLEHTIRRNYTNDQRSNAGSISMEEAIAIASVIYRYRPQFTLEIGFASGSSAAAIIATKKHLNIVKPHVVLDPYQVTHSNSVGVRYIRELGFSEDIVIVEELSEIYMSKLIDKEVCDLVLIDGGHTSGQAMVDAYFADRSLKAGGIVVIDDIFMKTTAKSVNYLVEECGYSVINTRTSNLSLLRVLRRSARLGIKYAFTHTFFGTDAIAVMQKKRDFRGGY